MTTIGCVQHDCPECKAREAQTVERILHDQAWCDEMELELERTRIALRIKTEEHQCCSEDLIRWRQSAELAIHENVELREGAQTVEPVAYLKFWACQQVSPDGDVNADEGLEVCRAGDVGIDGNPAFPVFTHPATPPSGERAALIKRLLTSWEMFTPSDEKLHKEAADMLAADAQETMTDKQGFPTVWQRGFQAGVTSNLSVARDAINAYRGEVSAHRETNRMMTEALTQAEEQQVAVPQIDHCQCPACCSGMIHASDCAVHNSPALPVGPCDCKQKEAPKNIEPTEAMKSKGLMALLRCSCSDLESLSPSMLDGYAEDVVRVYKAMFVAESQPSIGERAALSDWALHFADSEFSAHSPEAKKLHRISDMLAADAQRIAELDALSVTNIMLEVVPGDGSGLEVYAKSVADVESVLTKLSSDLEDAQGRLAHLKAALEKLRGMASEGLGIGVFISSALEGL